MGFYTMLYLVFEHSVILQKIQFSPTEARYESKTDSFVMEKPEDLLNGHKMLIDQFEIQSPNPADPIKNITHVPILESSPIDGRLWVSRITLTITLQSGQSMAYDLTSAIPIFGDRAIGY